MKKNLLVAFIILTLVGLAACAPPEEANDRNEFAAAYEALNGQSNSRGDAYFQLTIPAEVSIRILDFEQTTAFLDEGEGLLYIGRPGCPWCRQLLPTLCQVAIEQEQTIYYYDVEASREAYDDDYQALLARLDPYLPLDEVTQKPEDENFNPQKKRVVLPHLFWLEGGEIKAELMAYHHPYLEEDDQAAMKELLEELFAI